MAEAGHSGADRVGRITPLQCVQPCGLHGEPQVFDSLPDDSQPVELALYPRSCDRLALLVGSVAQFLKALPLKGHELGRLVENLAESPNAHLELHGPGILFFDSPLLELCEMARLTENTP